MKYLDAKERERGRKMAILKEVLNQMFWTASLMKFYNQ